MQRLFFICLFLFLTTQILSSQQYPVSSIDPSAEFLSPSNGNNAQHGKLESQNRILGSYNSLPLNFEMNRGQTDARVKFVTRTENYSLFLTGDEAVLAMQGTKAKRGILQGQEPAAWVPSASSLQRRTVNSLPGKPGLSSFSDTTVGADAAVEPSTHSILRMRLHDANPKAAVSGIDELAGKSNYFIGKDPARWHADVPNYAKVKYAGIYSGIDLIYYGNQRQLEYDFIVAPGANPGRIAFDVRGAKRIDLDAHGELVFKIGDGEIRWHTPTVYQERNGARETVAANYEITNNSRVGFQVGKYDPTRTLYIDPLIYSTYLGGSSFDRSRAVAVDGAGNAYITGETISTDYPVTSGAFQTTNLTENVSLFVTKFNPTGSTLIYSTYLGESVPSGARDVVAGIAVDGSGSAYIAGTTDNPNFPITAGAFQTVCGCGNFIGDGFVTKLNPTGSALTYSSFLGGSFYEFLEGIAVDSAGNAYVTGGSLSPDYPVTPGAFQTTNIHGYEKAFVTKFNSMGSALVYSTFLGGAGFNALNGDHGLGITVDSSGDAYVTGSTDSKDFPTTPGAFQPVCDGGGFSCSINAFVTKFNATGSGLVYSTFLGGTNRDWGMGIALDGSGSAYVTGTTYSTDFPTTPGSFQTACVSAPFSSCLDAFVTKLKPDGSSLAYSTYLGGTHSDFGVGIAVDGLGDAYVTGYAASQDFPTKHPVQATNPGPVSAFVTKIGPDGSSLAYSTYLGAIGGYNTNYEGSFLVEPFLGIALDKSGNAYVTGWTGSYNFPTANPLQPFLAGTGDAFVAKISAKPSDVTQAPLHLDFRNQPMGIASNPQVSILNNASGASLTISSITVTGKNSADFAQTNDCGASLQSGTSCSITVTFTPTAIGNRSATVKIVDGAPQQGISLTGLGLVHPITTLTSNHNPSALEQAVTFKVTVSSPTGGTPTGIVDVLDGGTLLLSKTLIGGTFLFTTSKLPLGLNALTAHYRGDATYGYSDGFLNQFVLSARTTTKLMSAPNPSVFGQTVTFTAVVTPNAGPVPPDGELVSFMQGKSVLGTGILTNGSATFTTAILPAAQDSITAVYGGDFNLIGSTSNAVQQIVNKAPTTTSLVSAQNPSSFGQPVTFTASVKSAYGGASKGSVSFYDGPTKLASKPLNGAAAAITISNLATGPHTISAIYSGNANFTGSSASLTQSVN